MNAARKTRFCFAHTLLLVIVLVVADQVAKLVVAATIPMYSSIMLTSWFNLVHTLNPGAAFSLFADAGGWQRYVLTGIGLAVSGLLLYWLWRGPASAMESAAYISLVGGALGNVADRIRLGAVVDYLDFHWRDWHWPAFNLADILVVSGATLLLLSPLLHPGTSSLFASRKSHR